MRNRIKLKNKNILYAFSLISCILLLAKISYSQNLIRYFNGNKVKWKKSSIDVCLDSSTSKIPNIEFYLSQAFNTWNVNSFTPKFNLGSGNCDVDVTYSVESLGESRPPLGTNVIHCNSDGVITSGKIIINEYYHSSLGDASSNRDVYDIPSILSHELGHVLGLAENMNDDHTVMYIYTEKGKTYKRNLSKKDSDEIKLLYINK